MQSIAPNETERLYIVISVLTTDDGVNCSFPGPPTIIWISAACTMPRAQIKITAVTKGKLGSMENMANGECNSDSSRSWMS